MLDEGQMTIDDVGEMRDPAEDLPSVQAVLLLRLRRDGGTQLRQTMNLAATQEYAEAMERGESFPPVVVFDDGTDLWLSDGFHRYDAHVLRSAKMIDCEVRLGTRQDAILYAARANRAHGVRLTPADREKIIVTVVNEFPEWGISEIAVHLDVTERTVYRIAERLNLTLSNSAQGRPRKSESAFTCACGEAFPKYVWHCVNCEHHWPGEMEACGNCHASRETAKLREAGGELDAIEQTLADVPRADRQAILGMVNAAGVPEEVALEAAQNVAAMSDEKRAHVVELIVSDDPKDQRAAIAAMRNLPYVHPLWSRVNTALGHMRHCLPAARGTEFEGACKIVIDHLQGLIEAIEAEERSTEGVTA